MSFKENCFGVSFGVDDGEQDSYCISEKYADLAVSDIVMSRRD